MRSDGPPGRRLRVALLEPAGRGGIHQYTRALAAALAACEVEVLLVTARGDEFAADDAATPPPFAVARRFDRWRSSPRAVLNELRAFAPDVVHLQAGTHPLLHLCLLLSARLATSARTVVTAHDVVPKNASWIGALASGLLQRVADRVIVHGIALAAELRARVPAAAQRIRVLPHGEYGFLARRPVDEAADAPRSPPTLLFFGYLHEEKGLPDLIEALPATVARVPGLRVVIAGKPEIDVAPLIARAEALGVAATLDWRLRYVEPAEVHELFTAATAVVLPYRRASQSGVVFLAGAFARPLIATRVGALPEVIDSGRTGLLVPPRDPPALASAMADLLSEPARARKMGREHARRCRTEWSWTPIAQRTRALYVELVTGREPPLAAPRSGPGEAALATSFQDDRELVARSCPHS